MGKRNIILGFFFFLIFIVFLASCSQSGNLSSNESSQSSESEELQKVEILLPAKGTAVYSVYVADELGFFEEEGLDVDIVAGHGSTYVVQQVGAGTVKVGFSVASAILPAVEKGTNLKYVYSVNIKNLFDFIVTEDSEVQQISDLKGKIIGVSDLGGGEVPMVRSILKGAGLDPEKDVTLRAVGTEPASILTGFENGDIDAYSSGANDLVFLYSAGFKARSLVPEEYQYLPTTGLTVTGETMENDRDLLVKVGRAVAKATLFSITNPDAAFNLMKQAIPEEYENDETGRLYLQTYIDLTTPTDISKGFGSIDTESWEITQNLFLEGEDPILSEPVDLDALLDESLLEEMNSFDVEEIEEMAKNWE